MPARAGQRSRVIAGYDYYDPDGHFLFEVVKKEPKAFHQRRRDERGQWVYNLQGVRLVPYRLPELLAADGCRVVWSPEGEKDVERLRSLGEVATCNPMGAGKWRPEYNAYFAGRIVGLLPDNDEVGHKHAGEVAAHLHGIASEIRIVALPGLPPKGDVSDWVGLGGTAEQLHDLFRASSPWQPPSEGAEPPRDDDRLLHFTDVGNGQRLKRRHGPDVLYSEQRGGFHLWDSRRFARDETAGIERLAKDTVRAMHAEADTLADEEARRAQIKWALKSESGPRLREMIAALRSEEGVAVGPAEFDVDPLLLNVGNGTLDLRTGILRPADRADRITKLAPVNYDPDAGCPTWLAFLDRVMEGRRDVIDFLRRAVGYSLTGDIGEHCLFLLYGTGRNGKSTFVETLGALLGDYAMTTGTDTLLVQRAGGIPNDIARLVGARLVSASESEAGRNLAEALVKQMTGGDRVSARFLRAEFFDFRPSFKLWFVTNHKPTIKGTDDGIWSRIRLVPFTTRIPDGEIDKRLPERLLAERPGILAWAVRGCLDWQREGLGVPDDVAKATAEYRGEMDTLATFLADCCIVGQQYRCVSKELYAAYAKWAEASGERVLSQKGLGVRLAERGFQNTKGTAGVRMWGGLGLTSGG